MILALFIWWSLAFAGMLLGAILGVPMKAPAWVIMASTLVTLLLVSGMQNPPLAALLGIGFVLCGPTIGLLLEAHEDWMFNRAVRAWEKRMREATRKRS